MRSTKRFEFIRRLIQAGAKAKLVHGLEKLGPQQSSFVFRDLGAYEKNLFIQLLISEPILKNILEELPFETFQKILSGLTDEKIVSILTQMPMDYVWAYLKDLEPQRQNEIREQLPEMLNRQLDKISMYPKESCGAIMQTQWFSVNVNANVEEVLAGLRSSDPQLKVFYLYVLDDEGHLLGTLPSRSLLFLDPKTPVSQIIVASHVAVQSLAPKEDAAKLVSQYKLLAVPVVDEAHHLLGIIHVDDVIDIVEEEATEDMYRMAGLAKEDRIFAPWLKTAKKRLIWMSINLVTAFLAAAVVGLFRESIAKVVALAIYMPIVAGMGGNGGTQSLTVMTRALALGEISGRESWRVLRKEVLVGLVVGGVTGLITGFVAWWLNGNIYLGAVLWIAMIVNMMVAGFAGAIIPMVLKGLGMDPALGSGVFVTTCTDVFGFLTFLGLATLFLKYLV